MPINAFLIVPAFLFAGLFAQAQQVPVQQYAVDVNGQVRLTVTSDIGKYYMLQVRHHPDSAFTLTTSMTLGEEGTTTITEPLKAYPPIITGYWNILSAIRSIRMEMARTM